jgi:hypothetical protein
MVFINTISKGMFVFLFLVCGCANNSPGAKEKVVAKVNRFELTVEDFKEGMPPTLLYSKKARS